MITGASGFIGSYLTEHLEHDDLVVNLAAGTGLGAVDPVDTIVRSVETTVAALEDARERGVRAFVHVATDEQYGRAGSYGWEWGKLAPSSPYAAAKIAQEAACHAYRRTYGVPVVVLTLDIVFGPGQPYEKVIPTMARAIRAGEPVPVFTNGGIALARRYTPLEWLPSLVRWVANHPELARITAPGETLDGYQLARRIAAVNPRTIGLLLFRTEERPDLRAAPYAPWTQLGVGSDRWRHARSFDACLRELV